ncbi:MAG TPA: cation:proton antiporter [Thermoplasmata archaeon]|nr:cation:proton antiporter [Thermoplasmata archaeon]
MAEPWVSLVIGGTLLLAGFAAALMFDRYRVPDFFMLLLLGVVLGHLPLEPFGPSLLVSLGPIVPAFIAVTLALIMFEGGMALDPAELGKGAAAILGHTLGAMALTMAVTFVLATSVLGLSPITGLVLAAAFSGPSATIVMSFAPQLRLSPNGMSIIVLEGVLGNVAAAVVVIFVLQVPGQEAIVPYLSQTVLAAAVAFLVGAAWRGLLRKLPSRRFVQIATLSLVIVTYAVADGLIAKSGPIAAFVLGLVVAYHRRGGHPVEVKETADLKAFQSEITFVLRTFFFVYLGLLMTFDQFSVAALVGAGLLVAGFLAARAPSAVLVARSQALSGRETRVLLGTVGRGMTDVVLVLFAIQSGVLPPTEATFLVGMLPLVILLAAVVCAGLLVWADRGREERPRPRKDLYDA